MTDDRAISEPSRPVPERATDRLTQIRVELQAAQDEVSRLMVERSNVIEEALAGGVGPTHIARLLEISAQRLAQLRKSASG